ncbi:hypothetical protein [Azohydromonas caseinilytica]|uniref:Uncharacterized protein n=1 Tax=Azohydromonas caseinilytica TaxID=2728836 RepID=A0A848FE20_9BURK|nr:hypothetical protein [Azohydromonas caseinilytica]NML16141.1 hypothetical protein [Azohydromonas caseinilytica]
MDAALLQEALGLADAADSARQAAAVLRERFAPLRVIVVDAMDMRHEKPAAIGARRALYLGASDGHCWNVTDDPAQAAGFFVVDKVAP